MAKTYKVNRVTQLPASGVNGDWYVLKVGERFNTYIVNAQGQFVLNQGVTQNEQEILNRLNEDVVVKIEGLKTQAEIDALITQAVVQSTAGYVPLNANGTLPTPTTNNNYTIVGGGVTYGTGQTTPVGRLSSLIFNGTTWSLRDMGVLPNSKPSDWTAKVYALGDQALKDNVLWEANAITAISDVPGVSTKWVKKVGGDDAAAAILGIQGGDVGQVYGLIPASVTQNASTGPEYGYYFYERNEDIVGKKIRQIVLTVATAGTFTILKIRNAGAAGYTKTVVQVLNLVVGTSVYNVNITPLLPGETLAFYEQGDTGAIRFSTTAPNPVGGGIKYLTFANQTWQQAFLPRDINVGINVDGEGKFSKKLESIEGEVRLATASLAPLELTSVPGYISEIEKLDTPGTSVASSVYAYYMYELNSILVGKEISLIRLDVATAGTFTILKIVGAGTPGFTKTVHQVLELTVGVSDYPITPLVLAAGEDIAFRDVTDTGNFRYASIANEKGGGFRYYNPTNSTWTGFTQANINIGISVNGNIEVSQRLNNIETALNNKKFRDKKISFIGDSILTYTGFLPTGNATYYPTNDVTSVDLTWWKKLLDFTGGILEVNNSWSGTRVSATSPNSFQERLGDLGDPDVIIVNGGTNDFNATVPLGNIDFTQPFDTTEFTDAYCNMLEQLSTLYPKAKIYCMTPIKRGTNTTVIVKNNLYTFDAMFDRIIEVCKIYGVEYLDMRNIGITAFNRTEYLFDGLHPNSEGMELMYQYVLRKV